MAATKLPVLKAGYYDFDPGFEFSGAPLVDDNDSTFIESSSNANTTFTVRYDTSNLTPPTSIHIKFEVMSTFDGDNDGTYESTYPYANPAVQFRIEVFNSDRSAVLGIERIGYPPGVHSLDLTLNQATLDAIPRNFIYGNWYLDDGSLSITTPKDFADAYKSGGTSEIRVDPSPVPRPPDYGGSWGYRVNFLEVQLLSGGNSPSYGRGRILVNPNAAELNDRWVFADGKD